MNATGVIIARFQTPFLHEGHKALIQSVKENHKKIVIVLGVSTGAEQQKESTGFSYP